MQAMQTAATENHCTILFIEHCWITFAPDILKPIEAMLEGSEILNLFGDDLESIASSLKHAAQLDGFQEPISAYFLKSTVIAPSIYCFCLKIIFNCRS